MKATLISLFLFITVIVLWIATGYYTITYIDNWTDRSAFGGMYGSVGALYSGLALIGVVYAILLQQQELKLQREEMEANREELRRAAAAQESSNTMNNLTSKLSALNSMLAYHNNQSTNSNSGIKRKESEEKAIGIIKDMDKVISEIKDLNPAN